MRETDEFRKMAEEISVKHTDVRSEDLVVLNSCRWSLSNDIEKALRNAHNRAVEECAKVAVMIEEDPDEERDKIRAKASEDIFNAIRRLRREQYERS